MGFNFNNEQAQSTGGSFIPPESMVMVQLSIRQPLGNMVHKYDGVTKTSKGLLQLVTDLHVISGTYAGSKLFDRFTLPQVAQEMQLTPGQVTNCNISGGMLRAMIEADRGIHPKDDSPAAFQRRDLDSFMEFEGMKFPIKIKYDDGFMKVDYVLTQEDKEFQHLMNGGEIITDKAIPERPDRDSQGSNNTYQAPPNQQQNQQQGQGQNTYQAPQNTQQSNQNQQPSYNAPQYGNQQQQTQQGQQYNQNPQYDQNQNQGYQQNNNQNYQPNGQQGNFTGGQQAGQSGTTSQSNAPDTAQHNAPYNAGAQSTGQNGDTSPNWMNS